MPCSDLAGNWIRGFLADDSADEATIDPPLTIVDNGGGNLSGSFPNENAFPIVCHTTGQRIRIEFTRTHAGSPATRTTYMGKVVPFGQRAMLGIIKGKFRRETTNQQGQTIVATGDWETEKPT